MIVITKFLLVAVSVLVLSLNTSFASSADLEAELALKLKDVFGDVPINLAPHDDRLMAVTVAGQHFFTTHDGRYLFAGTVLDTDLKVDLIVQRESLLRKSLLQGDAKEVFVSYPSDTKSSSKTVTVFTDIDCPYCRKLHSYMGEMNRIGISINYVIIPRGGVGSAAYDKALSALCSERSDQAITLAMQQQTIADKKCDSSQLDRHIALARELNINSTPSLVLPNGELKLGLIQPKQLDEILNQISNSEI